MNKNEFSELFEGISNKEFLRFGSYLNSPFFNVPKRIVKLFELLQMNNVKQNRESITREIISENFYPGKSYSKTQVNVRKLISEFKQHFNNFLAEREFEDKKFEQSLYLLQHLRKLNKTNEYRKILDETKELISKTETKDEEYYLRNLELYAEQYLFEGYHYKDFNVDLSFQISEYLDLYFIAYKLFLFQRLQARELVLKTIDHHEPKFYDAVCKEVEDNYDYYKNHPEIFCRYLMLKMNRNIGDQKLYDEYLRYVIYADEQLKVNCYIYYQDLLDYCERMVNDGKAEFEERILEFAELMKSKNMFRKYGIPYNDLKIIIESSIGTGKYDWGEEFVKKNIEYVDELYRENIYNLGLAKIYFFKKEYSNSRDHLIKVSYEDYLHYVDAKLIEARIEYEERCFVEISSIIEAVKKYLKSHTEIGDIYKQSYLAFDNFLNRLIKICESSVMQKPHDFEIKKLKEDIVSYPALLYGAGWLLEKLDEIEKGRL
jgi:hypothetical protein